MCIFRGVDDTVLQGVVLLAAGNGNRLASGIR
jgi:hypothetical protein